MARGKVVAAATAAAAAMAIERYVIAGPRYRGPRSDHFDGRRFHNIDSVQQSHSGFVKWQMNKRPGTWPRWIDEPAGPKPLERVGGGRLRVTLINHSTTLLQFDGVNVLTDPIWSMRCSPVPFAGPRRHRAPGIRFDDLPPIDAVLVSHNHYDHLDLPTLRRLPHAPVFAPLGTADVIGKRAIALDWWQSTKLNDAVTITLVPANHFCARALSDRNANLWGGFVIRAPAGDIYFAGDTGWGPHFAQIADRFDIRLALLPIGSYLPRWFMKPVHIDPREAVEAHAILRARRSVAIHYGTFRLGDDGEREPVDDLRSALAEHGIDTFHILEHGEGFEA